MAPKMIGWHINDRNSDLADAFVRIAAELGLTNSRAAEYAVRAWLESRGVWVFDPVGESREILITPQQGKPFRVPAEVAPYVDRYVFPARVIVPEEGVDYVVQVVDQ